MQIKSALAAILGGASIAAAVQPLEVDGRWFVNPKSGNRFQVVGIAYQPGGSAGYNPKTGKDPLSHATECKRDAALMQKLGINTIRVYNLDPNISHDECASIFNAAGMYMIIDVNSPLDGESLTSVKPWESYNDGYMNRTFAIVEAFKNYPNTLAFFSGNEVIQAPSNAKDDPKYMRAVTRDLKGYIAKNSDRKIPVGYSAADVRDVLFDTYNYLDCDNGDDMSRGDLFALNSYSWCGDSTFEKSTYDKLVEGFKDATVPIFFSEFGCNEVQPRTFSEIGTIYSDKMWDVMSGGVMYEYVQEKNNYGLVDIEDDGSAKLRGDFEVLANQYKKLDFKKIQAVKPTSDSTASPKKCSKSIITSKGFSTDFELPDAVDDIPDMIKNGINPKPSGKIVDISDYKVTSKVTDADGKSMSDLAVKPLADDQVNSPDGGTTSGGEGGDSDDESAGFSTGVPTGIKIATVALAAVFGSLLL